MAGLLEMFGVRSPQVARGPASSGALDETYPTTYQEWQARYARNEAYYQMLGYSVEEIKDHGLFRALDDDGKVIALTRQLTLDVKHVVDTDSHALGAGWTLEAVDEDAPDQEDGDKVWRRSQLDSQRATLTQMLASQGRIGIEACLDSERRGRLQTIDAGCYDCEYEADGVTLGCVWITIPFHDPATVTPAGERIEDGVRRVEVRKLTKTDVTTWIDSEIVEELTGDHNLGVVPFVNIRFIPAGDTQHGQWAGEGLSSALQSFDSLLTQIQAVGARQANPIPYATGAEVDAGINTSIGRWISGIPADGEIGYLEPTLQGLKVLLESAMALRQAALDAIPEFLYVGAGAGASGKALEYRVGALVLKLGTIREGMFAALARITDIAVRYERDEKWDPDEDMFRVTGAPIVPVDKAAALAELQVAKDLGLQAGDVIRGLQRLEMVPREVDPDAYGLEAGDQQSDKAQLFFNTTAAEAEGDE